MARCWDCYWMKRVAANAEMSTCKTRHVGAVLVRNNRSIADAFNGNLSGHKHCSDGGCPRCNDPNVISGQDLERCVCVHGEQNLVGDCARNGKSTLGATVYLPATSCLDCFKLLASCGVVEWVYPDIYPGAEEVVSQLAKVSGIVLRRPVCVCNQEKDGS